MCGRTALTASPADLREAFGLDATPSLAPSAPRYNAPPSSLVHAVRITRGAPGRMLVALRWGLVPFWAESVAVGRRLALARVESVLAAPAFRHAIRHRRCLIAVDGFYEWQRAGRSRRPFVMRQRDGRPFALGGIWERWKSPTGESIETCAVLTQPARPPVDQVHDRMPLVLSSDAWSAWLDPGVTEEARIATLLRSGDSEWPELVAVAVSSRVNDPRFDEPACFEPESTRQLEVPFPSVAASTATREGLPSRQA